MPLFDPFEQRQALRAKKILRM